MVSQNANSYRSCVHENRGLKKIVWQPEQEHSLVLFEMLFLYGGINSISQIVTLLALVKTIQKHTDLSESKQYAVLPETSKGAHLQFAAQPSRASVHSVYKLVFPKALVSWGALRGTRLEGQGRFSSPSTLP